MKWLAKSIKWKQLLAVLLILCLVVVNMSSTTAASDASGTESTEAEETAGAEEEAAGTISLTATGSSVTYLDADGEEQTCSDYTSVTNQTTWSAGWYVVDSDVTISDRINVEGTVYLILADGYSLTVSNGIQVTGSNKIVIYGQSTGDAAGRLTATGNNGNEAAIGGGNGGGASESTAAGTIEINGGIVEATGGSYAAAIGGGNDAWGNYADGGTITINGGTVTAKGGYLGAGIGGGNQGSGGTIMITGGTVTASGGNNSAGIGGGNNGDGGSITISGGYVTATAGSNADAIGNGENGSTAIITITGGYFADTEAILGTSGTGKVYDCDVADGYEVLSNTVAGTRAKYPVYVAQEQPVKISGIANYGQTLTVTTTEEITNISGYQWLRNGTEISDATSATYTITLEDVGAEISVRVTYDMDKTVTSASVTVALITYLDADGEEQICYEYTSVTDQTTWSTGWYVADSSVTISDRIIVDGTVNLILVDGYTLTVSNGIQVTGSNKIVIYGQSTGDAAGKLTATCTTGNEAGIGGGNGNTASEDTAAGTIEINGGIVEATGGAWGAGIGGGNDYFGKYADGGTITINGGTVTATGGWLAAGIGGGSSGSGGTITITGGTVTATGVDGGAGIGGGSSGSGGTITISGGYVIATANNDAAAAIGSGQNGGASTITITGGYFGTGDTSAATVYGISVGDNCCVVDNVESTKETYPCVVIDKSIPYTVTLNANGGTINSGNVTQYYFDQGATLPTSVTNGEYVFDGWYDNSSLTGTAVTEITTTDYGNREYWAKWAMVFVVSDATCSYTYENNLLTITSGGECTISMNTGAGITSTSADRILVTSNDAVTITIVSLNVTSSSASPFEIDAAGDVTIKLSGTNVLKASTITTSTDTGQYAGLQNTSGNTLTITSAVGDGSTDGSLTVTGGGDSTHQNGGAGLGGAYGNCGGTIIIGGGTIIATGGWNSAGIGGGSGGAGSNSTDGIAISGGDVTATSGASGAGIGGGTNGDSGNISISGGTVTATSSTNGAGIGAGRPLHNDTSVGTILVTGGSVTATSGGSGAGIGGGQGNETYKTTGGTIEISGDAVVTAVSESGGAGIGGGTNGDSGSITISGNAEVTATGKGNGAGIGGGDGGSGDSITISENANVTATGKGNGAGIGGGNGGSVGSIAISQNAVVIATGGDASDSTSGYGAGIGGGQDGNGGEITISGGTVTAQSTGAGAGIGTGWIESADITTCIWTVTISGGTVTATGGAYIKGSNGSTAGGGAGIGCGYNSTGSTLTVSGSISISGDAKVTAIGGYDCAGIGGTYLADYGAISISGNAEVTAAGGAQAAGIGGGSSSSNSGSSIEISGGTVTATGGTGVKDTYGSGAGIGGGHGRSGGSITISGGTVTAIGGGSETYYRGGAGIGSGGKDGSTVTANSGDVTVSGGTVIATGGYNAAGIGGGYYFTGGSISIAAGEVTANGGSGAAGIGGGYGGSGDTIGISGGTVTAAGGTSGSTSTGSGAGIGGGGNSDGGTIAITGGAVTATGGGDATYFYSGAGIGSGGSDGGSANSISSGTITIGGDAVVNATGGQNGAGIGGGYQGYGYKITIDGGTVTATSGGPGAGIGGGINSRGGTIVINGGTVTAKSSSNGAGIGGGKSADSESITINGGTVTATGTGAGAGIGGGSDGGSGGTITITGGYISAFSGSGSPIGGGASTTSGSNGSSGTITISGGCFGAGDKDAKTVYGVRVVTWCYVADNEEESTKTTYPYLVTECDHDYGEDGICSKCNYYQPAGWDDTNSRYEIGNPGQLLWFAALVNGDTSGGRVLFTDEDTARGAYANAVLTADIDMADYGYLYVPIGYTAFDSTGTATFDYTGYGGTFDGQGHVIKNLTISQTTVSSYETAYEYEKSVVGIFGTVTGTVKNLGVDSFCFERTSSGNDGRFGAIAGIVIKNTSGAVGKIENCYVVNSTVSGPGRVAGAVAGANLGGEVVNCYAYNCTVTATRTGYIVGDNNNSVLTGTVTNCYTDGSYLVSSNSSYSGTVDGGEANVSTERFASGEVAWLLQNGQDDESSLVWGQSLSDDSTVADAYPALTSTESLRVMKVAFYLVTGGTAASNALETAYTNNGSILAESSYPATGSSDSVYAFYTDSSCSSEHMIDTSEYAYEYETLGSSADIYAQKVSVPTYTVTIPATAELGGTATVSASGIAIVSGTKLVVTLTATGDDGDAFTVTCGDGLDTLTYTLLAGDDGNGNGTAVSVGDTILTVVGGTAYKSDSMTLTFGAPAEIPKYAGEYIGTLTFTVSVVSSG